METDLIQTIYRSTTAIHFFLKSVGVTTLKSQKFGLFFHCCPSGHLIFVLGFCKDSLFFNYDVMNHTHCFSNVF